MFSLFVFASWCAFEFILRFVDHTCANALGLETSDSASEIRSRN